MNRPGPGVKVGVDLNLGDCPRQDPQPFTDRVHHRPVIYRILSDTSTLHDDDDDEDSDEVVRRSSGTDQGGVWSRWGVDFGDLPLPRHLSNHRARFYFTEEGWRRYGRPVYASALQAGAQLKVIRRKNPDRSQVVYRDRWQLAILPRKDRD